MTRFIGFALALWLAVVTAGPAVSAMQEEDPLDARMREVATQLRCPVCQSESVFDSRATLAVEMKQIIREQLAAGKTQDEIVSFFQARYGDYVLMEPPRRGAHWLIWIVPFLLFLAGLLALTRYLHRKTRDVTEPAAGQPVDSEQIIADLERLEP